MSPRAEPTIAVVGATGAVGREALAILAARGHSPERVLALASERSRGTDLAYGDGKLRVAPLSPESLRISTAALFCASAEVAREHAPAAVEHGVLVVDNSSAFRMTPEVPLVIPEVNGAALRTEPPPRLVANPNCSTIILLMALEPLRRAFGLEHVLVSTYQAVSGAGLPGITELREQSRAVLDGAPPEPEFFREPCAFNVFVHESPIDPESGLNEEEDKIIREAGRIWADPGISVFPTCVRVPVFRAHSQSIVCDLGRSASEAEIRDVLGSAPGLRLIDDREQGSFPTPHAATSRDEVLVGRVRRGPSSPSNNGRRISLWVCGDQLRKGAALNAIQVLDELLG